MRLNSLLVAMTFVLVTNLCQAQVESRKDPPQLFATPAQRYSTRGLAADELHQMQYREVKEHLLRFYHKQDKLALLAGHRPGKMPTEADRDKAISELVSRLGDRWTRYTSPSRLWDEQYYYDTGWVHIGLMLDKDKDGYVAAYVNGNSAAHRAGLRRGDRIVSIDGKQLAGLTEVQAADQLYVWPSEIEVTYKKGDKKVTTKLNVETVDDTIVTSKMMGERWYFKVTSFRSDSLLGDFARRASVLNGTGKVKPQGIILDLRGNEGGLVDVAYQFITAFVKEGEIGRYVQRTGRISMQTRLVAEPFLPTMLAETEANLRLVEALQTAPLVVLVDESTISAGEMVTTALKGRGRAEIVGETTWGKGVAFQRINLSSGGVLQVCTAGFFGPDGADHSNKGIAPNVAVSQPRAGDTDVQLAAALSALSRKATSSASRPDNHSGVILLIFLGVFALYTLLLVIRASNRRRETRVSRFDISRERDFQEWVRTVEGDDPSTNSESEEEEFGASPIVLIDDHFMIGSTCRTCEHRFQAGETVVEVYTMAGPHLVCRTCRPLAPEEGGGD